MNDKKLSDEEKHEQATRLQMEKVLHKAACSFLTGDEPIDLTAGALNKDTAKKLEELFEQLIKGHDFEFTVHKPKKPEPWTPKGGEWVTNARGNVGQYMNSNPDRASFGTERATKELAEQARDEMLIANILRVYRDENYPNWRDSERFATLVLNCNDGGYKVASQDMSSCFREPMGAVLMNYTCARDIANKLNTGEIVIPKDEFS